MNDEIKIILEMPRHRFKRFRRRLFETLRFLNHLEAISELNPGFNIQDSTWYEQIDLPSLKVELRELANLLKEAIGETNEQLT